MINKNLVHTTIFSLALIVLILFLYPRMDIEFSQLFHLSQDFIYYNSILAKFSFHVIPLLVYIVLIISTITLLYQTIKHKTITNLYCFRILYLLITLAIGPGIIVNGIFKEHIGRARPHQVQQFGGSKTFSALGVVSHECQHNCSFPSGHTSMGCYFTAFAYLFQKYFSKIYISGLFFGLFIGLGRILKGAHFLSDILAACLIILIVNHLVYLLWQKKLRLIESR